MLPLILGIGAAALLLGRKVVKRVRSNPPRRKAARLNPGQTTSDDTFTVFGQTFALPTQKVMVPYQEVVYKSFVEANAHKPKIPCKGMILGRDLSADNGPIDAALIAKGFRAARIFAPVAGQRSNPPRRKAVRRRSNPRGWGSMAKAALAVSKAEDRVRRSALSGVPGVLWPEEGRKYGLTFSRCEEITAAARKTKEGREANRAWWKKHYGCEPPETSKRNPVTPYQQSQRARFGDYLPLARAIVAQFKESLIYARQPAREVFKQNVAQRVTEEMGDAQSGTALHLAKIATAQAIREVLENAQRRGIKVNPGRPRKGKRISVDQAAARLAWWRWHHNPVSFRRRRNPVQHIDHAAYAARVRKMTDAQLHYAIKDANQAIQAMPNGDKAGYYADEVNYCASELARRRKGGRQETNPRRRRRARRRK
jgi:hypothetical protein